ncbi:unnamed protein product [Gadus morhua 'NCC']
MSQDSQDLSFPVVPGNRSRPEPDKRRRESRGLRGKPGRRRPQRLPHRAPPVPHRSTASAVIRMTSRAPQPSPGCWCHFGFGEGRASAGGVWAA